MVMGYDMYRNLTNPTTKRVRASIMKTFQTTLVDPGLFCIMTLALICFAFSVLTISSRSSGLDQNLDVLHFHVIFLLRENKQGHWSQ